MSHSSDKYKRSLIILLSFVFTTAAGQKMSREFRKTFFKADKALEYGDYYSAMNLYSGIYAQDSLNAELNYKLGVCNYSIRKYRNRALKYFERTSVSDFPESNYYMGKLYHLRREYQKAIDRFTYYKFMMSGEEHTRKEIDDLIEKCNTAIIMESNVDRTLEVQNLGDAVNTEYPEYAPLIPAQENFMIFTSRRKNDVFKQTDPLGDYFEDLYISERKDKKWEAPVLMDTTINTAVHDAGTGLSADAERLLIYRTSKDLRSGDIYESNFVNSKWSAPQMLGSIVNDPDYAETSACYSPDGNTIFF
ncbi:MAG: tetratricopeptide repeat protein, partial [Bacteroidia bacterium]